MVWIIAIGRVVEHLIKEKRKARCGQLFQGYKQSGFLLSDPGCNTGLISGNWDGNLRNAMSERFQCCVQSGMGDAERGALETFKLRCAFDQDAVAPDRSNLF